MYFTAIVEVPSFFLLHYVFWVFLVSLCFSLPPVLLHSQIFLPHLPGFQCSAPFQLSCSSTHPPSLFSTSLHLYVTPSLVWFILRSRFQIILC